MKTIWKRFQFTEAKRTPQSDGQPWHLPVDLAEQTMQLGL
jgi:hypothetical protein